METSKTPRIQTRGLSTGTGRMMIVAQPPISQLLGTIESPAKENTKEQSTMNGAMNAMYDNIKIDPKKRVFRLTIQIDKVTEEPPEKKSKDQISIDFPNNLVRNLSLIAQEDQLDANKHENSMSPFTPKPTESTCKNGCKLLQTTLKSKPAFQCENCKKYYIKKPIGRGEVETLDCSVCAKSFPNAESLSSHMETHFICDICKLACGSRMAYNKHCKLHVSGDSSNPYKCHRCNEFFKSKEDIRKHNVVVHSGVNTRNTIPRVVGSTTPLRPITQMASIGHVNSSPALAPVLKLPMSLGVTTSTPRSIAETPTSSKSNPYHCVSCNVSFRTESAYKNHMSAHKNAEGGKTKVGETTNLLPISSPVTGNQVGILRAIKFTCRVCSKEFDNVGDVDKHTRTHLEHALEEHKCNVCKKSFKTTEALADHMKHHLIRGHPCPKCSKIFINKTTLKIHMKTHNDT